MKKRVLALFLAALLILSGCGDGSTPPPADEGETGTEQGSADQQNATVNQQTTTVDKQFQGPALWLDRDSVFTVGKKLELSYGSFMQFYNMSLPYEKSWEMIDYYVTEHLLGSEGFTVLEQYEFEATDGLAYHYILGHTVAESIQGNEYAMVLSVSEDDGETFVSIECTTDLTMEELSPAPTPTPTPTPAPTADPKVLPDFLETGTDYEVSDSTTTRMKVYTAKHMDISAVETYLQKLKDLGYTVVHTEQDSNPYGGMYRLWEFAHSSLDAKSITTNGAHITVTSNTYGKWNDQTLSIEFSAGITMDGEEPDTSSSSSSGGREDCPRCSMGKCSTCNGKKGRWLRSTGVPDEWVKCTPCSGTGKCTKCKGDGWIS